MDSSQKTRDFAELKNDVQFVKTVTDFDEYVLKIEQDLEVALKHKERNDLSLDENIKLDTYLSYLMNTLYWIHLKLQGNDVAEHPVHNEIARVRENITRDKNIEAGLAAPRIDLPAARRFIKRGLHIHFDEQGNKIDLNEPSISTENNKQNDEADVKKTKNEKTIKSGMKRPLES